MGLRTRVLKALGADALAAEAVRRFTESAGFVATGLIDPDEANWTKLSGSKRDLPSFTHDRAIEVCFSLYQQNPLGHHIVEMVRDFVVGDGLMWSASNPEVEQIVRDFWHDPVNNMDQRCGDFALELSLFGELAIEAFVSDVAGVVQLGYIDPSQIKAIDPLESNPIVMDGLRVKSRNSAVQGTPGPGIRGKRLEIIRPRDQGKMAGEVFYFRVNSLSNSTRGWSDLLHIADWLDALDQLLWELLERARLVKSFVWDVTLDGADMTEIMKYQAKYSKAPASGSVRFHNEKEQWQAVAPNLGSYETKQEVDVLLTHIAAGAGVPKTWLSQAEDVNKATATTMDVPTIRRLARRQGYFVECVRQMVAFALEQAVAKGRLAEMVEVFKDEVATGKTVTPIETVTIAAPEISLRDLPTVGRLLVDVSSALAVAEAQSWFGPDTSRQVLASVLAQLGVDYDPKDAPEAADQPSVDKVTEAAASVGA